MDITLTLSIMMEKKFMMQNARYKYAKKELYFLKTGSRIAAIPIDIEPLKIPSTTELII
jgi:hypothetical protein